MMPWMRRIRPRAKARPGRLKGEDLTELRRQCFQRDKGRCVDCSRPLRWDAGYPDSMHMAHIGAKRRHGDSLENVRSKCFHCHVEVEHWGGKVVPKKERP